LLGASQSVFFLGSVCAGSLGDLELPRHPLFKVTQNKSPEALCFGCLLEGPSALAALGREVLAAWSWDSLAAASGNAKRPGNQVFGKLSAESTFLRWS